MAFPGGIPEIGGLYVPPGEEGGAPDFSADGRARLKTLWPDSPVWRAVSAVWGTRGVRVIAVAHAASPRAGALAVQEIAFALSAAEQEILVVDLDLDHPTFPKPFQYQPDEGIVDMALYGASPGASLRKTPHDRVRVVTVGSPPIAASEVYASEELEEIVAGFRSEWDAVLLHVPLLVEGSAVCPALRLADVVILVAGAQIPTRNIAAEIAAFSPGPRVLGFFRVRSTPVPTPAAAERPTLAEAAHPGGIRLVPEEGGEARAAGAPAPAPTPPAAAPTPPPSPPRAPAGPLAPPAVAKPPSPGAPAAPQVPAPVHAAVTARAPAAPRVPAKRRRAAWILAVVLVAAGVAIAIGWGIARFGDRPAQPPRVAAARDARKEAGPPPASRPATAVPTKPAPADSVRLAKPAPADTVRLASPWSATTDSAAAAGSAPAAPLPGEPGSDSLLPTRSPVPQVVHPVGPAYGIQVSSNPSRARAAVDSAAWARKGQIVTIVAKDIPEKGGVWYRVVLGRYSGRDEARAVAERLRAAEGLEAAAVVSLPAR